MTVSIWVTFVIAVIALMAGLWIGCSIRWMAEETEEQVKAGEEGQSGNPLKKNEKRILLGWMVASPVAGLVRPFYEGNRCGVLIQPEEDAVYAPVSGRIIKLFPMGRAMLIATDFEKEILLKVGNGGDEMCSMYYRSRVVQNEIITKGKLLLEFDRRGLENQGVDMTVTVSLENSMEESNVAITSKEFVKTGEDLIWG